MLASPVQMTIFMVISVLIAFGICALGLKNGVERITKVMMLLLMCLMIVLAVHSLVLPNMREGLVFYLVPDLGKIAEIGFGNVLFAAMSHAFFTLKSGIGAMEIFGSYLDKTNRLAGEAVSVTLLDTFVALTAGIIIIPARFAYGVQPDSGPSLLFITLPNVFNHMAGGDIWGAAFFVFMTFAALSTVIAVFENILSMTMEIFDWDKKDRRSPQHCADYPVVDAGNSRLQCAVRHSADWCRLYADGFGGLYCLLQSASAGQSAVCAVLRKEEWLGLG